MQYRRDGTVFSIDLSGQEVEVLALSRAVRFTITSGFITLETRFTLFGPNKTDFRTIDPFNPDELPPLIALLFHTITASQIDEDSSTLTVVFDNGYSIVAGPDDAYESWHVALKDGTAVGCGPGGFNA